MAPAGCTSSVLATPSVVFPCPSFLATMTLPPSARVPSSCTRTRTRKDAPFSPTLVSTTLARLLASTSSTSARVPTASAASSRSSAAALASLVTASSRLRPKTSTRTTSALSASSRTLSARSSMPLVSLPTPVSKPSAALPSASAKCLKRECDHGSLIIVKM